MDYTCGEQRRAIWQEAEICECQCLDGQWIYGSKCDQDHIRKYNSKEHPYLEISLDGEHWVDLECIFGIYEETGTGIMEAIFYQMFLHEKPGQKIIRLRYKEVLEKQ